MVSPASTMAPFFGVSIPELDLDIKKMMVFLEHVSHAKKSHPLSSILVG